MIHIQRYIDRLAGAEARAARELVLPIADAKALHSDITRLLLALENSRVEAEQETIEVQLTGGDFRS